MLDPAFSELAELAERATGLLVLAIIGAGIALALRAERASRLVAEGRE